MHKAHQKLFEALDAQGAILVIDAGHANLTPKLERQKHTHFPIIFQKLDTIKAMDAKAFIAYLKDKLPQLKRIVVGYDFRFGKDRAFDAHDLKKEFDAEVIVVGEVIEDGISIHSRTIRAFLSQGAITQANRLLGFHYQIQGEVIAGQGLGAKELVPTLNIKTQDFLRPKEGVYATLVQLDNEVHFNPAVTFLGHRVTTDGTFAVETHVIDKNIDKTQHITIAFLSYLRDNQKFKSLEALKAQIFDDIKQAKAHHKQLAL